jgi:uncharacterized repeat protein (TIGR03803 family)
VASDFWPQDRRCDESPSAATNSIFLRRIDADFLAPYSVYGTTTAGGQFGAGTLFKLSPSTSAMDRQLMDLAPSTVDSFFASNHSARRTAAGRG